MRRLALIPSVCAFLVAVAACPSGDDTSVAETGGESSTSAGPSTSATTVSETTTDDTTVSTTASTTVSTTASTSSQDTGDTDDGTTDTTADTGADACAALGCAPDEYCDWPVNSCGDDPSDAPVCTPVPQGCPPTAGDPVCGCDGVVYVNDCGAGLAGIDVREANDCTPPDGTFACGYLFCDPLESYCRVSTSDVGGYPNGYACNPLPQACGDAPSCECLADEPCADFGCEESPEGGLTIVCPGG